MAHDAQTVQQAQWEYIDQLAAACETHGVEISTLWRHMETLNIKAPAMAPGMTVVSQEYRSALPRGVVVEVGDPNRYGSYAVWVRHGQRGRGTWVQVLGMQALSNAELRLRILEVDGSREVPAWVSAKAMPEDVVATREWLASAYREAKRVQSAHGWCPTFDSILDQRLGLNRSILRQSRHGGIAVGSMVSADEAAVLPEGTILRSASSDPTHAVWFMRVRVLRNAASTRRVLGVGPGTGGHFTRTMVVVSYPTSREHGLFWHEHGVELGMEYRLDEERVWDQLLVGTVIEYNTSRFVIRKDRQQRNEMVPWPDHGRHAGYRPAQLDRQQFRGIVAFPDTTGAGA